MKIFIYRWFNEYLWWKIIFYNILQISHDNNNNNNTKTNKMKMEFRWKLEHPEECIKEDNRTRPTKTEVYFVSIYGHIL